MSESKYDGTNFTAERASSARLDETSSQASYGISDILADYVVHNTLPAHLSGNQKLLLVAAIAADDTNFPDGARGNQLKKQALDDLDLTPELLNSSFPGKRGVNVLQHILTTNADPGLTFELIARGVDPTTRTAQSQSVAEIITDINRSGKNPELARDLSEALTEGNKANTARAAREANKSDAHKIADLAARFDRETAPDALQAQAAGIFMKANSDSYVDREVEYRTPVVSKEQAVAKITKLNAAIAEDTLITLTTAFEFDKAVAGLGGDKVQQEKARRIIDDSINTLSDTTVDLLKPIAVDKQDTSILKSIMIKVVNRSLPQQVLETISANYAQDTTFMKSFNDTRLEVYNASKVHNPSGADRIAYTTLSGGTKFNIVDLPPIPERQAVVNTAEPSFMTADTSTSKGGAARGEIPVAATNEGLGIMGKKTSFGQLLADIQKGVDGQPLSARLERIKADDLVVKDSKGKTAFHYLMESTTLSATQKETVFNNMVAKVDAKFGQAAHYEDDTFGPSKLGNVLAVQSTKKHGTGENTAFHKLGAAYSKLVKANGSEPDKDALQSIAATMMARSHGIERMVSADGKLTTMSGKALGVSDNDAASALLEELTEDRGISTTKVGKQPASKVSGNSVVENGPATKSRFSNFGFGLGGSGNK